MMDNSETTWEREPKFKNQILWAVNSASTYDVCDPAKIESDMKSGSLAMEVLCSLNNRGYVVNSASTYDVCDLAKIESDMKAGSIPTEVLCSLSNRGYMVSNGACPVDEFPDTGSATRKTSPEIEWGKRIRGLVESGDVVHARKLLLSMGLERATYFDLDRWFTLLDLPKVERSKQATGKPFSRSADVLKANIDEYAGKWVALVNDKVLGSDRSKIALYRNLKEQDKLTGAMFFYVEH